ncbi:hypothetical protein J9246_01355 [Micrococcus luteus]|nr:hypothetical protein [Micrococcus luteus]MBS9536551.1 hypothetical protein [Micrococcus luteus]
MDAAEFLSKVLPNFGQGSKPTTKVLLLDGRPLDPGAHLTEADTHRVEGRHQLECEKCINAGTSAPLYVRPERLWKLLDTVAATGVGEVPLDLLVKMNGALT